MITTDSRYRTATLQTVTGPDDVTRQEMRVGFPKYKQITYTYYVVKSSDRIDILAAKFYNNGRLWWLIADANPEIINWLDLEPGTQIRIPSA